MVFPVTVSGSAVRVLHDHVQHLADMEWLERQGVRRALTAAGLEWVASEWQNCELCRKVTLVRDAQRLVQDLIDLTQCRAPDSDGFVRAHRHFSGVPTEAEMDEKALEVARRIADAVSAAADVRPDCVEGLTAALIGSGYESLVTK